MVCGELGAERRRIDGGGGEQSSRGGAMRHGSEGDGVRSSKRGRGSSGAPFIGRGREREGRQGEEGAVKIDGRPLLAFGGGGHYWRKEEGEARRLWRFH